MNKYQEALERAKICGDNDCCDCKFNEICINDKKGWYGTLKELVNKAIPKKPKYLNYGGYKLGNYHCPNCNSIIIIDNRNSKLPKHCDKCDQLLDWSDEDE